MYRSCFRFTDRRDHSISITEALYDYSINKIKDDQNRTLVAEIIRHWQTVGRESTVRFQQGVRGEGWVQNEEGSRSKDFDRIIDQSGIEGLDPFRKGEMHRFYQIRCGNQESDSGGRENDDWVERSIETTE